MITFPIFGKFLIAIAIGALIGLEREMSFKDSKMKIAGIRTFIFISFLGALSAFIYEQYKQPLFMIAIFCVVALFVIVAYGANCFINKDLGLTTEMSALIAFILGLLTYLGEEKVAIIFTVLTTLFLSLKKTLHKIVSKVQRNELYDTLKFALISLVVLPFLPNQTYDPWGIINPYKIWLVVILVTGISFFGYLFIKFLGPNRGIGITGLLGGLASSTALMTSMSNNSKNSKGNINPFIFAAVIASSTMFIRILIEVSVLNKELFKELLIPMGVMGIVGIAISFFVWRQKSNLHPKIEIKSPFTLLPGIKFGLFFVLVLFVSKLASIYFGNTGIYIASVFSGLADVDAITISMANLAGKEIALNTATIAITIAAAMNTFTKFWIAYLFGSRQFAKAIAWIFAVILACGFISIFFIK